MIKVSSNDDHDESRVISNDDNDQKVISNDDDESPDTEHGQL